MRLFTELHGDMSVGSIKRTHARQFVSAPQDIRRHRPGKLQEATLPELAEWRREHTEAPRLSQGTINKLIGGVQAVSIWAHDNGLVRATAGPGGGAAAACGHCQHAPVADVRNDGEPA
jgi:hypothetical protein